MEAIITSLATFGIVLTLVGILFKTKSKEIEGKVNKEICEKVQEMHNEKFGVLFEKFETLFEDINEMKGDLKVIKKLMNGE